MGRIRRFCAVIWPDTGANGGAYALIAGQNLFATEIATVGNDIQLVCLESVLRRLGHGGELSPELEGFTQRDSGGCSSLALGESRPGRDDPWDSAVS